MHFDYWMSNDTIGLITKNILYGEKILRGKTEADAKGYAKFLEKSVKVINDISKAFHSSFILHNLRFNNTSVT